MTMEQQMDLEFGDKPKEKIVIPYSERIQRTGESKEEYTERIIALNKKVVSGEHTWGEPTKNELAEVGNQQLEREGVKIETEELHDSNIIDKLENQDPETRRKIEQMKKRKDIYD